MEFIVGLDLANTEPGAVRALFEMARDHPKVAVYCFTSLTPGEVYHPKLYLLRKGRAVVVLVGSSNLTLGGLERNREVNLALETCVDDDISGELYAAYSRLKFCPDRFTPDEEFVGLYADMHRRWKQRSREGPVGREAQEIAKRLADKSGTLRRPRPEREDLVGWLELVYDALPDGEFSNQDVYQLETQFSEAYPDNRNVRAKIRQQLQQLRDMELLRHLGSGRWQKV